MEYNYKSRPIQTYESTVVEFTLIDQEGNEHEYREWYDTKLGQGLEYWDGDCWVEVEDPSDELSEMLNIMEEPIKRC